MPDYLNPAGLPYPEFGMNPGVATRDWVFAGGMALDFETITRRADAVTIADETRLCLQEIEEILHAAGATMKDIVKMTCYLSDDAYRPEFWTAYKGCFDDGPYPSRVTYKVGIAGGCRVELDAIAVRPRARAE